MADENLSDRERLLLETARREVIARRAAQTAPGREAESQRASRASAGTAGASFAGTPLDASTVVGWDHPAARAETVGTSPDARIPAATPSASERASPSPPPAGRTTPVGSDRERWARAGELLKAERMAEEARRERLRRNGLGAIAALLLVVLAIAFVTVLPHLPH